MGIPQTDGKDDNSKPNPSSSLCVGGGESYDTPPIPKSVEDEELINDFEKWNLDSQKIRQYLHPDNDMVLAFSTLKGKYLSECSLINANNVICSMMCFYSGFSHTTQ